jgi:hypothetical protein
MPTTTAETPKANGTTPGPVSVLDPVAEALKRQTELVNAQNALLAAKLPKAAATGVDTKVTFNPNSGYFAELLAYHSMVAAVNAVAGELPSGNSQKLLLVTDENYPKVAQLWEFANTQLEAAQQRLDSLLANSQPVFAKGLVASGAATLATAAALIGAAGNIVSFFRSNLTVTAKAVAIPTSALIAACVPALKSKSWIPVLPMLSLAKSTLLDRIEKLLATRQSISGYRKQLAEDVQAVITRLELLPPQIESATDKLEKARVAGPLDAAAITAAEGALSSLQNEILGHRNDKIRWESIAIELEAAAAATDSLVTALLDRADGQPSVIEAVAPVDLAKADPNLKILLLLLSSQGGEMHVSQSLWRNRLTYIGGVVLSYFLLDQHGNVEKSGIVAKPLAKSLWASSATSKLILPNHGTHPAETDG